MDELFTYENEVGDLILEEMDPVEEIGDISQFGWAGIFDTAHRSDFVVACVIVGVWPDESMAVEGFTDAAVASFRWLQWCETFDIPTLLPSLGDMVVVQLEDSLVEVNSGLLFANWKVVEQFAERAELVKKGKRLFFLDQPLGNYKLMDLNPN